MKIAKDNLVNDSRHQNYSEFDRQQLIVDEIQPTEKIKIVGVDTTGKETVLKVFTAKYINCHFNGQWQDKGTKTVSEIP